MPGLKGEHVKKVTWKLGGDSWCDCNVNVPETVGGDADIGMGIDRGEFGAARVNDGLTWCRIGEKNDAFGVFTLVGGK